MDSMVDVFIDKFLEQLVESLCVIILLPYCFFKSVLASRYPEYAVESTSQFSVRSFYFILSGSRSIRK